MPTITLKNDICNNFDAAIQREWILTNGIGGYASSTIIGANNRRYHGLLVAAAEPPLGRRVLLSKLEETIIVGQNRYELSCNQYPEAVHPNGHKYLEAFKLERFPIFRYVVDDITLEKSIFMAYGENITVITYRLLDASVPWPGTKARGGEFPPFLKGHPPSKGGQGGFGGFGGNEKATKVYA